MHARDALGQLPRGRTESRPGLAMLKNSMYGGVVGGGWEGEWPASACTRMRRSVRCTVGRMSMRTPIHGISLSFSDSLWFRQQV